MFLLLIMFLRMSAKTNNIQGSVTGKFMIERGEIVIASCLFIDFVIIKISVINVENMHMGEYLS